MSSPAPTSSMVASLYEWPVTKKYDQRFVAWPFISVAVSALLGIIGVLIYTNYNAQTCSSQLVFEYWTQQSASSGCVVYDSAFGDWSSYATTATQLLTALQQPRIQTSGGFGSGGQYAPTNCSQTLPLGFDLVNISIWNLSSPMGGPLYFMALSAEVLFTPTFALTVESAVPAQYNQYLLPGWEYLSQTSYPGGDIAVIDKSANWNDDNNEARLVQTIYFEPLAAQLDFLITTACGLYTNSKHLQSCTVCVKDSTISIVYLILLTVHTAAMIIYQCSTFIIQHWNKRYAHPAEEDEETCGKCRAFVCGSKEQPSP